MASYHISNNICNTRLRSSLKVYLYTAQLTNMSENPEEEVQGESDHHEFRVVLKGLNIPIEVRKRIEAKIRQDVLDDVLKEIAGLDLRDEHIMDCDVKKHQEEMAKSEIYFGRRE
jgi:hypothetical protein